MSHFYLNVLLTFTLGIVSCEFVLTAVHCVKKRLWLTILIYGCKNRNFEDILILCPFSRITVVHHPWGLWAPKPWLLTRIAVWLRKMHLRHLFFSWAFSGLSPSLSFAVTFSPDLSFWGIVDQQACFVLMSSYSFFRLQLPLSTLVLVHLFFVVFFFFHELREINNLLAFWGLKLFKDFMVNITFFPALHTYVSFNFTIGYQIGPLCPITLVNHILIVCPFSWKPPIWSTSICLQ